MMGCSGARRLTYSGNEGRTMPTFDKLFAKWHPDPITAVVTVVLVPIGLLMLRIVAKWLKTWVSYIWEGIFYWVSRFVMRSFAAQLTLKRYCRLHLKSDYRYLYVPSRHDIKIDVDDIFVTLQLEHHGGKRDTYTHKDLLEATNRLRIMGDPGSGKTSLSKRIFRDHCRLALTEARRARLPCIVELKTIKIPSSTKEAALGDWLYSHIRGIAASSNVYKMDECFDTYA